MLELKNLIIDELINDFIDVLKRNSFAIFEEVIISFNLLFKSYHFDYLFCFC